MLKAEINSILKSSLVKSFGIYTISKVLNSCIPFFLLPILTSYLTPADYGVTSMIITVSSFMMPLITLRVEDAIVRKFYDDCRINIYIGNCIYIVLTMTVVISIALLFCSHFLSEVTEIPYYIYFFIPLYCFFSFFKTVFLYYLQVQQKAAKYGVFSILATLLEFSMAIAFVVLLHMTWQGQALAMLIATSIAATFAYIVLRKSELISYHFDKGNLEHALHYGLWLVPAGIGGTLMVMANRLFLTEMVSIDETGLYGVATSFAGLLAFITVSFNNAFVPWLFPQLNKDDWGIKKKIVKISYLYMFSLFILVVIVYFFVKLIMPVFIDAKFYDSDKYLLWLLIGYAFQGCYFMVTNYIMYVGKTKYTAYITVFCGVLSVILNYVLISLVGAEGASLAFAITFMAFFGITWFVSAKLYKMPWLSFNEKELE